MAVRIPALKEALVAQAKAMAAATSIADILARLESGKETIATMHDEINDATAIMLVAAEQMRTAIHEFRAIDKRITGGF